MTKLFVFQLSVLSLFLSDIEINVLLLQAIRSGLVSKKIIDIIVILLSYNCNAIPYFINVKVYSPCNLFETVSDKVPIYDPSEPAFVTTDSDIGATYGEYP